MHLLNAEVKLTRSYPSIRIETLLTTEKMSISAPIPGHFLWAHLARYIATCNRADGDVRRDKKIDEMGAELFQERRKVNELEHKLKKLGALINRIPDDVRVELLRSMKQKDRGER